MRVRQYLKELLGIVVGSALAAVALVMFLIPNRLAPGGVSGLAVILFHMFSIPVGLTMILINLPLFYLAYRFLGLRFLLHTLVGAVMFPLFIELFAFLPVATTDLLLASVYGGVVMGLGLGIVFRANGSTGGTALLARLLNRFVGVTTGSGLLGADILILFVSGVVFGAELTLYATLSLAVSSWIIDVVQEGISFAKTALIITRAGDAIIPRVLQDLGRGVTRLEGRGGYTNEPKDVLLCVVNRNEVSRLKRVVCEVDPTAFLIVGTAHEVLGEGFRRLETPSTD